MKGSGELKQMTRRLGFIGAGERSEVVLKAGRMERSICWTMCAVKTSNHSKEATPNINKRPAQQIVDQACERAYTRFCSIEKHAKQTLQRVLNAMRTHRLSQSHFTNADGYGHADYGVEVMDGLYSRVFGAEWTGSHSISFRCVHDCSGAV